MKQTSIFDEEITLKEAIVPKKSIQKPVQKVLSESKNISIFDLPVYLVDDNIPVRYLQEILNTLEDKYNIQPNQYRYYLERYYFDDMIIDITVSGGNHLMFIRRTLEEIEKEG